MGFSSGKRRFGFPFHLTRSIVVFGCVVFRCNRSEDQKPRERGGLILTLSVSLSVAQYLHQWSDVASFSAVKRATHYITGVQSVKLLRLINAFWRHQLRTDVTYDASLRRTSIGQNKVAGRIAVYADCTFPDDWLFLGILYDHCYFVLSQNMSVYSFTSLQRVALQDLPFGAQTGLWKWHVLKAACVRGKFATCDTRTQSKGKFKHISKSTAVHRASNQLATIKLQSLALQVADEEVAQVDYCGAWDSLT